MTSRGVLFVLGSVSLDEKKESDKANETLRPDDHSEYSYRENKKFVILQRGQIKIIIFVCSSQEEQIELGLHKQ